jgi:hypothetical protein
MEFWKLEKRWRMTESERKKLDELIKDRTDSANNFEKPSNIGVWHSIIHKYSDQAHFIYELLQNADDVKATNVNFELVSEGLYFKHNGTDYFNITDIATEKDDYDNDALGDINAITGIGFSGKKHNEGTIGTFGMGFKAVFQYTKTPHIYDPNFQFKIERFIVPKFLENDLKNRNANETIFYFPFDKEEMSSKKAYEDILSKLKNLTYPTLFLSNLKEVFWKTETENGKYWKRQIKKQQEGNMSYEKIELFQDIERKIKNEKIWLFSRRTEKQNLPYSVSFFLNENEKLKPVKLDAFCFFPTKENTNLNFIIHAPFLLTDSREGIKKGQTNNWNENLIEKLAELAADSLLVLKNINLIDDDIIKIIPYKKSSFEYSFLFTPFYDKIKKKLQTEELLPSLNGEFTNRNNAYLAEYSPMTELYSNNQLASLTDNANSKWAFTSIGRNYAMYKTDKELGEYLNEIIPKHLDPEHLLDKITKDFITKCGFEWLYKFYEYLLIAKTHMDRVKIKPIFKDINENTVPAFEYDNKTKSFHNILFLPTDYENSDFITIHPELLKNEKSKEFILSFGITEPDIKSEIYKISKDNPEIISKNFGKLFKYYKEFRDEGFINIIKDKEFVRVRANDIYLVKANEIYCPSDDLIQYFENKPDTLFLDLEFYHNLIKENEWELLNEFLRKLGINYYPKIIEREIEEQEFKKHHPNMSKKRGTIDHHFYCRYIDNIEFFKNIDMIKSLLLWKILRTTIEFNRFYISFCLHKYQHNNKIQEEYDCPDNHKKYYLCEKWLLNKENERVSPQELYIDDLSDKYDIESEGAKKLIEFLGIKKRFSSDNILDGLTNDEIEELKKRIIERDKPIFPISGPYPIVRKQKIVEGYINAKPIIYQKKEVSERISSPDIEPKEYLKPLYTNTDKKLLCQICKNEMPFNKKNGQYYFEKVEIFSKTDILTKETEIAYICCCPICAAKYKFIDKSQKNKIKEEILNENITPNKDGNYEIPISYISLNEVASICFVHRHFMDLKTILNAENETVSQQKNNIRPDKETEIQVGGDSGININDRRELELLLLPDEDTFRRNILMIREAHYTISYINGGEKSGIWIANNLTETSSIKNNIRSGYLRDWKEKGIKKAIFWVESESNKT